MRPCLDEGLAFATSSHSPPGDSLARLPWPMDRAVSWDRWPTTYPFEIRPIAPFTNEWAQLAITLYAELVHKDLYTRRLTCGQASSDSDVSPETVPIQLFD
jgi:hypothetical protein